MPTFGTVPIDEAGANNVTGQRAALLQEYAGYIQGVPPGQAGKLEPGAGETTQAVRRRLNAAAELLGVSLEVRRTAGAVYSGHQWAGDGPARIQARSWCLNRAAPRSWA